VKEGITQPDWCGAQVSPGSEPFSSVTASWVVPMAYPPASAWADVGWADGYYVSSIWVGLDGYRDTQVLQAGTMAFVQVLQGAIVNVDVFAWYEWYSMVSQAPSVRFKGFPVQAGDLVNVLVRGGGKGPATEGGVVIANMSRGLLTTANVTAPDPQTEVRGSSAEWIVERTFIQFGDGTTSVKTLPNYGASVFFDAVAGTADTEVPVGSGTAFPMFDTDGKTVISQATIENDTTLLLQYVGR
jgi:hypothetical protein